MKLGEHLRLHPVVRGRAGAVPLRARGGGLPALEPAREEHARQGRRARSAASSWPSSSGCSRASRTPPAMDLDGERAPTAPPEAERRAARGRGGRARGRERGRRGPSSAPSSAPARRRRSRRRRPAPPGRPVEHYDDLAAEEVIALLGLARARGPPDAARVRARSRQSRAGCWRRSTRCWPARGSHGLARASRAAQPSMQRAGPVGYPDARLTSPRMRQRSFILVAVLLLVLVGGAVAAYAYDSSRDDLIAKGVTVAGRGRGRHDDAPRPRRVVARELQEPLERPIAVRARRAAASRSPPQDAGVQADVGGMVDEALDGEPRRQHHHAAWRATSPAARRTPRCRRG